MYQKIEILKYNLQIFLDKTKKQIDINSKLFLIFIINQLENGFIFD